jgi:hypothetical protein
MIKQLLGKVASKNHEVTGEPASNISRWVFDLELTDGALNAEVELRYQYASQVPPAAIRSYSATLLGPAASASPWIEELEGRSFKVYASSACKLRVTVDVISI